MKKKPALTWTLEEELEAIWRAIEKLQKGDSS